MILCVSFHNSSALRTLLRVFYFIKTENAGKAISDRKRNNVYFYTRILISPYSLHESNAYARENIRFYTWELHMTECTYQITAYSDFEIYLNIVHN